MVLHHIGVVVRDLDAHIARMSELLGAEVVGSPVDDPLQEVRVAFVSTGTEVSIELIQPANEDSPVSRFLDSGGGLNHLCYAVEDLDASIEGLRGKGCLVASPPKPAVAFSGRRVAFLYTRDRELIELVEV
jgi:methylmalonyl-CoA/ethylmalonyl-CoA epimerase